jgi:hypothetical protein
VTNIQNEVIEIINLCPGNIPACQSLKIAQK